MSSQTNRGTHAHRTAWVAAALIAGLAGLPADALAQRGGQPRIEEAPVVTGTPRVGEPLQASDPVWSGARADSQVIYTWVRCTSTSLSDCAPIGGATGSSYSVAEADAGRFLRVVLTIFNRHGRDAAVSMPTALVAPEPPPPPPPPPPAEPPASQVGAPPAAAPPATAPPAAAPPAGEVLAERARLMRPFPVVRIRGHLTARGAAIRLFTVRTPRATRVTVRCLGRRCPRRAWRRTARRAGLTRVKAFERHLRAGVRLRVRVVRPGFVGKQTMILIRRGKVPARRDRCLLPGARRPTACRAS